MRRWCLVLALGGCRTLIPSQVPHPPADPSRAYDELLQRAVTPDGYVDYDYLSAHRGPLDDFVAWLGQSRTLPRANLRHAFMLNAYNALVLYQVLERGRPASVQDVKGWLPTPGSGFFVETAFLLDGTPTSLHEISNEYLRFKQLDFRDHAAMACGARSCPPMRAGIYETPHIEKQLRDQMVRWLDDDARGVQLVDGVAVFNPIFEWYAYDFDFQTVGQDLCTIAAGFVSGPKRGALRTLALDGCPHRFAAFDWSLNHEEGVPELVREDSDVPAP